MIRKLVNWLLYKLHIKQPQRKSAVESLTELIPTLYAAMVIVGMLGWLSIHMSKLPWYMLVWLTIKFYVRHARAIVVGY